MASTYTGLGTELMTTGENAGTWGSTTNTNLQIIEQMVGGYVEKSIAGSADTTTLAVSDGSAGAELAHRVIKFTGTISEATTVTVPLDVQQMYILMNGTSGNYTVTFKYVTGSGDTVVFKGTDKGTKLVYATADHATNPNMVDTGIASHQIHNTLTVGIDDTGYDVKLFGATSGSYALWDESADDLVLAGAAGIDLAGDIDVDGTANLDTVDIDGNTQADGTITVGANDTGYDVKLFGATASSYMLWDESADSLLLNAATLDLNGTADGLILDADGDTTISSPSDDQIDFEIAGADDFTMTANTFTILSGSTIAIAAGGAITNAGTMAPDITSTGKALVMGF